MAAAAAAAAFDFSAGHTRNSLFANTGSCVRCCGYGPSNMPEQPSPSNENSKSRRDTRQLSVTVRTAVMLLSPLMKLSIGVARRCSGCTCTPRAVKKFFSGLIYREMCKCTPQDTKCTPSQSKSQFLGQFLLRGLDFEVYLDSLWERRLKKVVNFFGKKVHPQTQYWLRLWSSDTQANRRPKSATTIECYCLIVELAPLLDEDDEEDERLHQLFASIFFNWLTIDSHCLRPNNVVQRI